LGGRAYMDQEKTTKFQLLSAVSLIDVGDLLIYINSFSFTDSSKANQKSTTYFTKAL